MAKPKRKPNPFTLAERERRIVALGMRAGWFNHLSDARGLIREAVRGNREAAMEIFYAIEVEAHLTATPPAETPGAVELGPVN